MDLVSANDVGPASLGRMIREGILTSVGPGFGAPLDLPIIRADRVRPLVGTVPRHTVLSGLAGLWVHAGGDPPRVVDLVGVRGLHRPPPGSHPPGLVLRFHSGSAANEPAETIDGIRIADPARCIADALRWGELGRVFPAVVRALRDEVVGAEEVAAVVERESPRGRGLSRVRSAWAAITIAEAAPTATPRSGT